MATERFGRHVGFIARGRRLVAGHTDEDGDDPDRVYQRE